MQRGRTIRDCVIALLNHHGTYDPTIVMNPTHQLQLYANEIYEEEMDAAMAVRQAAADAIRLTREERAAENVCQEGAFGAIPHEKLHHRRAVRRKSKKHGLYGESQVILSRTEM